MQTTIVTGASGFVGEHLVKELSQQGYKVIAVIRDELKQEKFKNLSNVEVVICDMKDIKNLPKLVTKLGTKLEIEAFFHLAWEGSAGAGREDYNIHLNNIKYSCDAVEVASEIGCKQFVYAGSLMEFESTSYIPTQGSKPVRNYVYRTAKMTAHYMGKAVAVSKNIEFKMGIISNAYGAGELSPRLVNTSLRKLLNGEKTSFTAGTQYYDFIYITDVAKAFLKIMEQGKAYHNYYIGNETQLQLCEFVKRMGACVDPNIDLGIGQVPFDGVTIDYNAIDTSALFKDTDFTCEIDFETGINKTIEWIKNN